MKEISYSEGKVTLDLRDVLDGLPAEEVADLADYLSCNEQVIKNVSDQIIDGFTEMNSYGLTGCNPEKPSTALDIAVRNVAKMSGEISKSEIESLERRLTILAKEKEEYSNWAWAMYHSWNESKRHGNVKFPSDFNEFRIDKK